MNELKKSIKGQNQQPMNEILFQSNKKEIKVKSKFFILCCGAIENAKIILNNSINYKILKNSNTGKYYMDHPRVTLGTLISKNKFSLSSLFGIKSKKLDIRNTLRPSDAFQIKNNILSCHAYLDPYFGDESEKEFDEILQQIKKIVKLKGFPKLNLLKLNIKKILEQFYFNLPPQISNSYFNDILRIFLLRKNKFLSFKNIKINYQGEQFPNVNSKIYLSDKKDVYGQYIPILDWRLCDVDYRTQKEFTKILKNITNNHSYLSFKESNNLEITDASHHSGTTRMSLNKSDGVVNKNCKFHDIKNLFICGNSVFRTIGSGNPGLTNMALSNKLGKHLDRL